MDKQKYLTQFCPADTKRQIVTSCTLTPNLQTQLKQFFDFMPAWSKSQRKSYSKRNRLTRRKGSRRWYYIQQKEKDLKKLVTASPESSNVETGDGLTARGISLQTSGIPPHPDTQSSPAAVSDPLPATIPLDQLVSKVKNHLREIKNARRRKGPAITFDVSDLTIPSVGSNLTNSTDGSSNRESIAGGSSNVIDISDDSSDVIDISDESSNLTDISDDSSDVIDISDDSSNLKDISEDSSNLRDISGDSSQVTHISDDPSNLIDTSEEETETGESVYFLVSDAFE